MYSNIHECFSRDNPLIASPFKRFTTRLNLKNLFEVLSGRVKPLFLALVCTVSTTCQRTQTFEEGMVIFCEAPKRLANVSPEKKTQALATILKSELKNPDVLKMLGSLKGSIEQNDTIIRESQRRAKLDSCYFLDAPNAHQ